MNKVYLKLPNTPLDLSEALQLSEHQGQISDFLWIGIGGNT